MNITSTDNTDLKGSEPKPTKEAYEAWEREFLKYRKEDSSYPSMST